MVTAPTYPPPVGDERRVYPAQPGCHPTVDGWCATHSDEFGPVYCMGQA